MSTEKAQEKTIKVLGENKSGWGVENMPNPTGAALIQARWDLCIGCGACVAACPNGSAMLFVAAKVSHLALFPQGQI